MAGRSQHTAQQQHGIDHLDTPATLKQGDEAEPHRLQHGETGAGGHPDGNASIQVLGGYVRGTAIIAAVVALVNALVVLLALAVGTIVGGIFGAILAVPVDVHRPPLGQDGRHG